MIRRRILILVACCAISVVLYLLWSFRPAVGSRSLMRPKNGSRTQGTRAGTGDLRRVQAVREAGSIEPLPSLKRIRSVATKEESLREKIDRLLLAVNSRETAIEYLEAVVDQSPTRSLRSEEMPKIEIVKEEGLSLEERALFEKRSAPGGEILIPVRVDGVLSFHQASPFPAEFLPPHVRAYLSEDDIRDFQDKIITSSIEQSVMRGKRGNIRE